MNCSQCGEMIGAEAAFCGGCGAKAMASQRDATTDSIESAKLTVKGTALRVWRVLLAVLRNPTGNLSPSLEKLSEKEMLETGIGMGVLFTLCFTIGMLLIKPAWTGTPGIGDVLKMLIGGIIPVVALAAAMFAARKAFRGVGGNIRVDLFVAGTALLPFAVLVPVMGLLGIGNLEVSAIVAVFAISYTVLILFAGCTRVAGIAEERAVPAVPVILLIAGWISKIIVVAILT